MNGALRVLLVEDSPTDAKLVLRELEKSWHPVEFSRVETAETMRAELDAMTFDVILSDWSMPVFSGLAALAILKERGLDIPFLLVSGTVGEEVAVDAMRAGARDYVLKDRLVRLGPAIEREIREQGARESHRINEETLRRSRATFAHLSEAGLIGIITAERGGGILEANDAFLAMIGYSRDELRAGNVRWRDLTPQEWQDTTDRNLDEVRASGVVAPYEKEYIRRDGTRLSVLIGLAKLEAATSIAFMIDMTAQRRAEALLRKTEAQFLQAQKMDAVGRLAAGIAHDFNNLLSIILSYTAMLIADDSLPEAIRSDITEIDHAGTRAGDLTRRLLMFSRQDVVEPRVVDVNTSLTSMDKMLQRLLGEDVHLVCSYEPALGSVFLDPSQLDQILINLAVNARDAMPGGGKLSIETANVVLDDAQARERGGVLPGSYVMIAVRDDGAGMDAVTQSQIFDPFFTTKERGRGTGLGLSTVFGIIERCRGGIWVTSEVGVGSSFEVYLPRIAEPADSAIGQQRTESVPPALHGDETILLVEDDAELRAVARTMLRKHGYSVIDASGGEGALRQWAAHGPKIDLLLTDVVMPQMSGPELARRLMIARPTLKVLCMSGYTDDAIFRQEGAVRGMAYLQKPITLGSLLLKVRQVLDAS